MSAQICFWSGIPIATSYFSSLFSTHKGLIASKLRKFIILVLTDMRPWHCQKTCQPIGLEFNIKLINQFHAIKMSNCASLLSHDTNVHNIEWRYIYWILVNSNLSVDSIQAFSIKTVIWCRKLRGAQTSRQSVICSSCWLTWTHEWTPAHIESLTRMSFRLQKTNKHSTIYVYCKIPV